MLGAGQTGISGLPVGGAGYGLQDGVRMCGNSDRHVLTGMVHLVRSFLLRSAMSGARVAIDPAG